MEYEHCFHQSDNSTCGVYEATYIVNDIENQGFIPSQVFEYFELIAGLRLFFIICVLL